MNQPFKYSWQEAVFDAFLETRPDCLPGKINAAQRAISTRLCDSQPPDVEEHLALHAAFRSLRALQAQQRRSRRSQRKEVIA